MRYKFNPKLNLSPISPEPGFVIVSDRRPVKNRRPLGKTLREILSSLDRAFKRGIKR